MSRLAHPAASGTASGSLSHEKIWAALDALAARYGLSPSGLAKRAGLDATTFNRSKRRTADGRLRWPSTESIAKVLDATGATLAEFLGLPELAPASNPSATAPMASFDAIRDDPEIFDPAGVPRGDRWGDYSPPDLAREAAFAIKIVGDDLRPTYRDGDVLVASPRAPIRDGDRVLAKPAGQPPIIAEWGHEGDRAALRPLGGGAGAAPRSADGFDWIIRIILCGQ
jgi:phage repressor protein C with HTH and peptisase S24 domain